MSNKNKSQSGWLLRLISIPAVLAIVLAIVLTGCGGGTGGNNNTDAVWDTSNWDEKNWQ